MHPYFYMGATKVFIFYKHPRSTAARETMVHCQRSPNRPAPTCSTQRYVTSQNATAAKDEYGDCVQVLDGDREAYAAGLCERVANCYWKEPREYRQRERRYTDEQYEANERAIRDYMQAIVVTYGTLGFVLAVGVLAGCVKFAIRRWVDSRLNRHLWLFVNIVRCWTPSPPGRALVQAALLSHVVCTTPNENHVRLSASLAPGCLCS